MISWEIELYAGKKGRVHSDSMMFILQFKVGIYEVCQVVFLEIWTKNSGSEFTTSSCDEYTLSLKYKSDQELFNNDKDWDANSGEHTKVANTASQLIMLAKIQEQPCL